MLRSCQNPRDRVYALYGLDLAAQAAHPPEYNKETKQVMLETVQYICKTERHNISRLSAGYLIRIQTSMISLVVHDPELLLP